MKDKSNEQRALNVAFGVFMGRTRHKHPSTAVVMDCIMRSILALVAVRDGGNY